MATDFLNYKGTRKKKRSLCVFQDCEPKILYFCLNSYQGRKNADFFKIARAQAMQFQRNGNLREYANIIKQIEELDGEKINS